MKRIWILTELFYPEQTSTSYILTKIANRFSEIKDCEVKVISGPAEYDKARAAFNDDKTFVLDEHVNVERVSCPSFNKNKLSSRLIRQMIISLKMAYCIVAKIKRGDIVFIVTNPAPLLLLVAFLKGLKKYKFILYVNDVFPENTIPARIIKSSKSTSYRLMSKLFNKAYQKADTLITIGRDMDDVVRQKLGSNVGNSKTVIIENWADIDIIQPQYKKPDPQQFKIQFAGNLGRVQGLMEFLEMFHQASNPNLHLDFWGDGAMRAPLEEYVNQHRLSNVSFHGAFRRDQQNEVLNDCDIALVTLSKGMYGLGVPSKSYNIMAAGKSILFIGDVNSEIPLELAENKIGVAFGNDDKEGIINWLRSINADFVTSLSGQGMRARMTAEDLYSEEKILNKFAEVVS